MSTTEPPDQPYGDDPPPEPQDPDFIRAMAALRAKAQRTKAAKEQALTEWSQADTDEQLLADLGLDIDELRQDP
ncbi:hypothetical protein GCM10011575_41800 [Microlunatus endophyticus]|uniref:Uncharacterized protein n=1 Tax=Microlunatus endophyticus TaxID=1716077 RepID=A0A917SFI7_9ACTN|nr:hypothetical protein [Microlunatus endophyticus]GGL79080.1 hypothetical protein GCM10011575_41800 [Microlunatus endophyticus]